MPEYTPTTDDVRTRYTDDRSGIGAWTRCDESVERAVESANAEFDRWYVAEIAWAKAEALREFADTRGVNVGDEDDDWWRGYRQAQRECLQDALVRAARLAGTTDTERSKARLDPGEEWPTLPLHRTEAGWPNCATCDGGGCPDCTDPA